jgi:hypothetical protein
MPTYLASIAAIALGVALLFGSNLCARANARESQHVAGSGAQCR